MERIPELKVIARIHNGFSDKFGVPRQSGLVEQVESKIIFEPEYRSMEAVRGIEEYSHIWLLWIFTESVRDGWSATVRPPRLGGNQRVGVFATRSPFRPNEIGLSSLRLLRIVQDETLGPVLYVSGADMIDGTPIVDIKPYLPYVDSHPEALGGFAHRHKDERLAVVFPEELKEKLGEKEALTVAELLAQDPRPAYQEDAGRIYGMQYQGYEVKFRVEGESLTVCGVYRDGEACSRDR